MKSVHPQKRKGGQSTVINNPSKATPLSTWECADIVATVIPGGEVPVSLNGVALVEWADAPHTPDAWGQVVGALPGEEPPFTPPAGMRKAAGVVVEEGDGRIWLVAPTNQFGGYTATFPKGTVEEGMSLHTTAIVEAYEEAGLRVEILGFLMDVKRSQSFTRYYWARRIGGSPAAMGWESQAVHLVPKSRLSEFLTSPYDAPLLQAILADKR